MTENEWSELVKNYGRESAEEFQAAVNAYNEKKVAALVQKDSARKAIGKMQKPVMEEILREKEQAETAYLEAEKIYNQMRTDYKGNQDILDVLSARLEQREKNYRRTCQN